MKLLAKIAFSSILFLIIFTAIVSANEFKVTQIYDGDTFKAEISGIEIKVRLAGIDAPETSKRKNNPGQPFANKAKEFLSERTLNKKVILKYYGLGSYNRQICEVFINGKNINLELIKLGLAQVYEGKHPKKLNYSIYEKAQSKAKIEQKGIWSQKNYISPKEWRNKNKRN